MNSSSDAEHKVACAPDDALEALMSFGVSMWRAGSTAIRTRECMEMMAQKIGFDEMAISLSLDSITATVRRSVELTTTMRVIGPPGVNAWRIGELEELAKSGGPDIGLHDIATKLAQIESAPPLYSRTRIVAAIALASASFALLNGAGVREATAAAVGGGTGQCLRLWLSRRQQNQLWHCHTVCHVGLRVVRAGGGAGEFPRL